MLTLNQNNEQVHFMMYTPFIYYYFTPHHLGPLPDIQIIPLNIPGMKTADGKNQKAFSMGVSVPSKFRSLLKYTLHAISEDMEIEYVDFTMKYDQQKKVLYNKLVRSHHEFMHNHKTVNIHCMEREEMKTCCKELIGIPSVIAIDETVITERNGTWVLVMKYNNQTGFDQTDLDKIDSIITNNPTMTGRKLHHNPFRKKQPIESLNLTALSGQESRFKNFTATPFSTTDSWSSRLFPPRNITTSPRGGGRSNKTAISIDDDTTVATIADTVSNLQRSVDKLTTQMATLENKVVKEETRGEIITVKIDALEATQKTLADSLIALVTGIENVKEESKKEAVNSRKDASELKEMMMMLMSSNNNNNRSSLTPQTQQTVNGQIIYGGTGAQSNVVNNGITPSTTGTGTGTGTGTEKRKHTPSSSPEEKEISSPDHRKQRQHQHTEVEIDQSNNTLPIEIDFGRYANDTNMGNINNSTTTLVGQGEDNNNDTEMGHGEDNNAFSRSSDSFCSIVHSDTATVIEETHSIPGHNLHNVTGVPEIIATTHDGFTAVQNGSPNRNAIRERQQSRINNNPYSALQSSVTQKSNNNNNSSAKDRNDPKND